MAPRKKTGGRKKGTPNRPTQALRARLESLDFDIVQEAVILYRDCMKSDERSTAASVLGKLLNHAFPTLKQIDADIQTHEPEQITIRRTFKNFYEDEVGQPALSRTIERSDKDSTA